MTVTLPKPHHASHAQALLTRFVGESRGFAAAIEHLQRSRSAISLHETIPAARPALFAVLHQQLGGQILIAMPTADAAERAFADLLYYLGEDEEQSPREPRSDGSREPLGDGSRTVALLRARDESLGAIESPSEQSARLGLFGDLADGKPRIVLAPVAALRQYIMPPRTFSALRRRLRVEDEAGWDATLEHLHRLGYNRADVVSAVGEYAVRGGILDVFPATAESPVRIEFFGDRIDAIRSFDLASQLSTGECTETTIAPWSEIPRDSEYRERILQSVAQEHEIPGHAGVAQEVGVARAVTAFLEADHEIPESWLPLAYDEHATIFDYLRDDAKIVLDEPSILADIERALDEELTREQSVMLADIDSGELSVRDDDINEALLGEVTAPRPHLSDMHEVIARFTTLVLPGAIEGTAPLDWVPEIRQNFVFECRPVEHFNRQITMFTDSMREAVHAGESITIVTTATARVLES